MKQSFMKVEKNNIGVYFEESINYINMQFTSYAKFIT